MAVYIARAAGVPLELELDPFFGVHKPGAAVVHRLVSHGVQIDQQPELVVGLELCEVYVLLFFLRLSKEAVDLFPYVFALDAIVVHHVGLAVDRDADFGQV